MKKALVGMALLLDHVIDAMMKDGTYQKIEHRYFDFDISGS